MRPIQRTCRAILTAHELKKVTLQYNLKDTGDLLRKIDKLNEERALEKYDEILHVSFDIVAMFPGQYSRGDGQRRVQETS